MELADLAKKLEEDIGKTTEQIKAMIGQRDAEIKKQGNATEETGKKVDKLAETLANMENEQKELALKAEKRLSDVEVKLNRPDLGVNGDGKIITPGEAFTNWEGFKTMSTSPRKESGELKMFIAGLNSGRFRVIEEKDLTTVTGEGLTIDTRVVRPETIAPPPRAIHLRDLLTVVPVGGGEIEYVAETGYYNLAMHLTVAITGGDATMTVDSVAGVFNGMSLTVFDGTNTETHTVLSFVEATKVITLDGTTFAHAYTIAAALVYGVTFTPTAEAAQKVQSALATAIQTRTCRTLANWIPVTRQLMEDSIRVSSYVNGRLREGLLVSEDRNLLNGSGTSPEIHGIINTTGVQTYSWSSGSVGDNKIDAIGRCLGLARIAEYEPDNVVMGNANFVDLQILKGGDGHYINGILNGRVWNVPITPCNFMNANRFLLGSFKMCAELYDRHQIAVRMTDSHEGNFTKNILVLLMEERIELAVTRPQGFVYGYWDAAPVAP